MTDYILCRHLGGAVSLSAVAQDGNGWNLAAGATPPPDSCEHVMVMFGAYGDPAQALRDWPDLFEGDHPAALFLRAAAESLAAERAQRDIRTPGICRDCG